MDTTKKIDAVFEGGGVKGTGLVGAIAVVEREGYQFENVAGTSAGAIVAALVAAGYTSRELKAVMDAVDYRKFRDCGLSRYVPVLGSCYRMLLRRGLYRGAFFESFMQDLLRAKGVHTFGDLFMEVYRHDPRYRYKLQVIASDITRGKLVIFPRDAQEYGIHPDRLEVAAALRMSMSIPFFFEPVLLRHKRSGLCHIVDGGILSNFPVWLFDDGTSTPPWPTIGFKLVDPNEEEPHRITGPMSLFTALFATLMEAHDARYIEEADFLRTIPIPTMGVRTTEFDVSAQRRDLLYQSGMQAAEEFFERWNFEEYKQRYRYAEPLGRREKAWGE